MPDPCTAYADLPPRWAELELRVEALYPENSFGIVRGIAKVEKAAEIENYLEGQRVYFSIKAERAHDLAEGVRLPAKGIVARLPVGAEDSFHAWLSRGGVYWEYKRVTLSGAVAPPGRLTTLAAQARGWMRDVLMTGSETLPEIRELLPSMMLGDKALMSPEDRTIFRETGMMHLFAVSGLNVALAALVVEGLLALLRVGRLPRILAGQVLLLAYVAIIGAPASAVRAFLMIFFLRAASLWGRPAKGLPALAASGLAVLVWDPLQLFDIGAQLSYAIVIALLVYGAPLAESLKARLPLYEDLPSESRGRVRRLMITSRDWLIESLAVSFAAFAVSLPLSIAYFGYFAPGSVLLNLLMIPLALAATAAAVVSLLFALAGLVPGLAFFLGASAFLNHAGWLAAWEMEGLARASHDIPLFHGTHSFDAPWQGPAMTAALLFLMCVLSHRRLRGKLFWMLSPLWALAAALGIASVIELLA